MSKSKFFSTTPTNIVLLSSTVASDIDEVRGDELRVMIDLFTDDLKVSDLRALAFIKNGEWVDIIRSEQKYRKLSSKRSEVQGKIQRSLITPLQCALLDSWSDTALACALAMAGTCDLQWEFSERYVKHNTSWFCSGNSDTLVSWLRALQASPRMSTVLAGYAIEDEDIGDEDHDGYVNLQIMSKFLCPAGVNRMDHVLAVAAWIHSCADAPNGKQLTLFADYPSAQGIETLSVKAYHVEA